MKKILITSVVLLLCWSCRAQLPDSTAILAEQSALQQRHTEIRAHFKATRASIRELKAAYKTRDRDPSFRENMAILKKEQRHWRGEYRSWQHDIDDFAKKREAFDRSMLAYYRTQPFFKYRNKSELNMAIGVGLVTAGGVVCLGGLINAMMEAPGEPQPAASERQRREQRVMAYCMVSGATLALCSIPFFRAANRNKARFKEHINWSFSVTPAAMPNGYRSEAIGFDARIPLFNR